MMDTGGGEPGDLALQAAQHSPAWTAEPAILYASWRSRGTRHCSPDNTQAGRRAERSHATLTVSQVQTVGQTSPIMSPVSALLEIFIAQVDRPHGALGGAARLYGPGEN